MTDFLALLQAATPAWHDRAACRNHGDLFFPGGTELMAAKRGRIAKAKAICARCPVAGHCHDFAAAHEEWANGGIWAGLSPNDVGMANRKPRRAA